MEIARSAFRSRIFLFFARFAICDVGSEPIDSMQTSGVRGSDSAQVASKSKICISPYSGPRDSVRNKNLPRTMNRNRQQQAMLHSHYLQRISLPVKWSGRDSTSESTAVYGNCLTYCCTSMVFPRLLASPIHTTFSNLSRWLRSDGD